MNRRIDALLDQGPIQVQLHVTGSFEFLKYDLVHATLGLNQGGRQDCQAATFLTISGRPKEAFGLQQGLGLDAARHYPSLAGLKRVVTASQSSNAVQKNHNI